MNINRICGRHNFGMAYWFEPTRQLIFDAKADSKDKAEKKYIRNLVQGMEYYCPDEEVYSFTRAPGFFQKLFKRGDLNTYEEVYLDDKLAGKIKLPDANIRPLDRLKAIHQVLEETEEKRFNENEFYLDIKS